MKLAVLILNWNRKDDTIDCLKSLDKVFNNGVEVKAYVIDNGSTDDSIESLNKLTTPIFRLIKSEKNLGYAGGNNFALPIILEDKPDWIMILNNDTLLDRKIFKNFENFVDGKRGLGVVSPKIYFAPGYEFHKDKYPKTLLGRVIWAAGGKMDWNNCFGVNIGVDDVDRGQFDEEKEIDFATGAALFIKREIIEKIGLFDDKYYMYFEDVDLCKRVLDLGYRIMYAPKLVIWHKVSASSGIGSDLNDYFITRNRLLFGLRYAPIRTKLALLREAIKFRFSGRAWQRIGVKDYFLNIFGRGSWK